jgi:imidazolonepropionase-like amidohydrolase
MTIKPSQLRIAGALFGVWLGSQTGMAADVKAFVGAAIYDGTGKPLIANATLVETDGRITAVGPSSRVKAPKGAQTINVSGKTIVPGLISGHAHTADVSGKITGLTEESTLQQLGVYARYGITTVFSLGGELPLAFKLRDAQDTPTLNRSRIYVAGPVIVGKTPEEVRAMVDKVADMKPNYIKMRVDDNLGRTPKPAPEIYRAAIDEAHKRGLRFFVHYFYLDDAKDLLRSGADFLAHSVRDREVDDDFMTLAKKTGVCYSPTLTRELSTFVYESTPAFFSDPFFLKEADPQLIAQLQDPKNQQAMHNNKSGQAYKAALPTAERNLKKLSDAGIPIVMGTDSGASADRFEGYFEHLEMQMMAESGMTPEKILKSATSDAASCMKINNIGTLEVGKWADLVVMDKNPLEDIKNTETISSVWIAGNQVKR